DNSQNQFMWTGSALDVQLNSSLDTVRLQRPLGVTLGDTDDFTLSARFSFNVTSAPGDQGLQIAFGLVNSSLTGGDRTGSLANFSSDNTFHTVEFNYFPNAGVFGGPTLTPVAFGAQKNGGDAFANLNSLFGADSDLGGNTNGITALP